MSFHERYWPAHFNKQDHKKDNTEVHKHQVLTPEAEIVDIMCRQANLLQMLIAPVPEHPLSVG